MEGGQSEAVFLHKEPCPACGSRDNLGRYSDGHGWCFGCGHYEPGDGSTSRQSRKVKMADMIEGTFGALSKRGITEETCRKFGYAQGTYKGRPVQIAPYYDQDRNLVGQKIRFPDKEFTVAGSLKEAGLFGSQLWDGGRKIVVTEGEIDALTVSQLQGNKWPVVSIPNGAQGAAKALRKNLDYLLKFDEVVLMFDMDEPGKAAAIECATILPPGRAKIASLPFKDPNECLQKGKGEAVVQAIWNATTYRPDGIVTIADLREEALKPVVMGLPWFLEDLTKLTYGRRRGEIYTFGAGTGVGKTDWLTQQIAFDIVELKQKVGIFFLEQQPTESAKRVAGKIAGKRFHVPDAGWDQADLIEAFDAASQDNRLFLYDHFGVADWDTIASRIRFLAHSEGVRIFYIDHLTALADPASERESLETIMGELGGLVKELDILVHLVSHLATPEGKPHEEGGRVTIRHFKGSRSIGFWSHFMFGLERDQQADDPRERQTTTFRVLKDRYTGQATGAVIYLGYDRDTGRLFKTDAPEEQPQFNDETQGDF